MMHMPLVSKFLCLMHDARIFQAIPANFDTHLRRLSVCIRCSICKIHSLRVGWRNLVQVSLIFAIIVSFMLFTVFPLVYVLYFEEFLIHDSRGFMILKKIGPNLLGLCYFPLNN